MISFIETEHFKKVDCIRVDLTKGTNLILGDNGLGKTTLFNAVKFALYGVAGIASDKENIPTWGSKNCTVKVGFAKDFLVVRTLKDCKIYKAADNGDLLEEAELKVAEGNSPCTAWVKDHYGLDSDMFDIFNMSLQGETGALITLGATKLNQVVENYSGVGVLDNVIKSLSQGVSSLKGAAGTYEYTDTRALKRELKDAIESLEYSQADLLQAESALNEATVRRATAMQSVTDVTRDNARIQTAKDKVANLLALVEVLEPQLQEDRTLLNELQTKIAHITDIDALVLQRDKFKKDLTQFSLDSDQHTNVTELIEETEVDVIRYEALTEKEVIVDAKRKELDIEVDLLSDHVTAASAVVDDAEDVVRDATMTLKSGACTKCHRDFENFDKAAAALALSNAQDKLTLAMGKYKELRIQRGALTNTLNDLPASIGAADALIETRNCLSVYKVQIQTLEAQWEDFEDEEVDVKLAELNTDIMVHSETTSQLYQVNKRVTVSQEKFDTAKATTDSQDSLAHEKLVDVMPLQRSANDLTTEVGHISGRVGDLRVEVSNQRIRIHNQDAQLDVVEGVNTKLKDLEGDLDKHTRLIKYLRTTRTDYMGGVWASILGAASGFINKTTQGWITEIGRSPTGNFTFTENGIVGTVKGDASGAQKEFIGVSLRIGLGMALQGDRALLMLDEPTGGMTEANADKLATGLLGVAGQKIVITHRSSERLTAANIINL